MNPDGVHENRKRLSKKTILWISESIIALIVLIAIIWGSVAYIENQNLIKERSNYNNIVSQYSINKENWTSLQQKALTLLATSQGKVTPPSLWDTLKETASFKPPYIAPASANTVSSFRIASKAFENGINELNSHITAITKQTEEVAQSYASYVDAHKNTPPAPQGAASNASNANNIGNTLGTMTSPQSSAIGPLQSAPQARPRPIVPRPSSSSTHRVPTAAQRKGYRSAIPKPPTPSRKTYPPDSAPSRSNPSEPPTTSPEPESELELEPTAQTVLDNTNEQMESSAS